jgi:glycosyltransferase involved in cell wall biosynthesis
MSLGIPQVVPQINGYSEYCTPDNSMMVKPKLRYYVPQSHNMVTGQAEMVDPEDVSKAMERYVFDEDMRTVHGKLGKELATKYSWENCTAILFKRLQALEDD